MPIVLLLLILFSNELMSTLLRFLLLLLAGASIMGARHASRQSHEQFSWPATHALRPVVPTGTAAIAELTRPVGMRRAL